MYKGLLYDQYLVSNSTYRADSSNEQSIFSDSKSNIERKYVPDKVNHLVWDIISWSLSQIILYRVYP